MLLATAVKAISVVGLLTRNFHASFSIIYSPNIHYNDKGAALRYSNLALVLFPLLPKGQQLNLLIGISSFFLIQHHPLISVLDSSSPRRLLRRRQSTSTFSEQID